MSVRKKLLEIKIVSYQTELESITKIRTKVFQEEQGVTPELEFDGLDNQATQFLAFWNNQAVGTARVRMIDQHTAKIERLAVLPIVRRQGIGKELMIAALQLIRKQNKSLAVVHAQTYIAQLYHELGFSPVGEIFREADIKHVKMTKQLPYTA